jgi:peptide/nickel transport system permease protein
LGVLLIIFCINKCIPGDPAKLALGSNYTEEAYQAKRAEMGLDKSYPEQFIDYVVGVVTKMDLGTSYDSKQPVSKLIFSRIGITIKLGLLSCVVTIVAGVGIGILSAVKKYSPIDYATTTFAVIFSAAPGFWVALMAMLLFCLKLKWLPAGGMGTWKHMVLPVVCMALSPISLVARITRTSMLDVINQDYIRTARAKGVQERTVIFSHALRNALIPVVTVIGAQLTMVVGGSFIIESVFSIPGIGMLLLSAINTRDFPTIQGTVLVLSFFVCIINLMTDVAYAYVDPRIKSQYSGGKKTRNKRKEGQNG